MARTSVLRIAHLYPALMNLYGDRGNIIALRHRASLRGIRVEVTGLSPGDRVDRGRYHLFFFGGGQDAEQSIIYGDFIDNKGSVLGDELRDGAACLAVCGGYQLLGKWYEVYGGKRIDGIGYFDAVTRAGRWRAIGNILIEADLGKGPVEMVGFENHGGRTYPSEGIAPLGKVLVGGGNNGEDGFEGAIVGNSVGTYLHGPVLPKNPALTDFLLERAMRREDSGYVLAEAPAEFETAAFRAAREITLAEQGKQRQRFSRRKSAE